MKKNQWLELIGYCALIVCLIGNLIVGYYYFIAEILFLISNVAMTIRCFILHQPKADKLKNVIFTIMTIGLIIKWLY